MTFRHEITDELIVTYILVNSRWRTLFADRLTALPDEVVLCRRYGYESYMGHTHQIGNGTCVLHDCQEPAKYELCNTCITVCSALHSIKMHRANYPIEEGIVYRGAEDGYWAVIRFFYGPTVRMRIREIGYIPTSLLYNNNDDSITFLM